MILNDLNPLRTNFLNVIKTEPLKLIKQILESDLLFIEQPETKNPKLSAYKKAINDNAKKRAKYHKVDCNIDIAYQMFIVQCINKAMVESAGKIMERIFRFLPAHLKLQNWFYWMFHTSFLSILVLLLVTNISLSTRR